jgi:hypothetical protein
LLSHLTSRPGVQSTLILSRKDGSIIQSTGLLAANAGSTGNGNGNANANANLPASRTNSGSISTTENPASGVAAATAGSPETIAQDNSNNATTLAKSPYKPTQAEALAAHIHAFTTSASGVTLALSGSTSAAQIGHESRPSVNNGVADSTADDQDKDNERDEDDEIKLLRLRTKKHEIVVVPDRKYLLCVVHDASGASAPAGASR